jgi:predicted HTH domain antitoxin
METIAVTLEFPKSFLTAAGVRKQEVDEWLRESAAIELYRQGRVSLGKATEMLGLPTKWEMISVLAKHDLWFDYTAEDAEQDWETLKEVLSR